VRQYRRKSISQHSRSPAATNPRKTSKEKQQRQRGHPSFGDIQEHKTDISSQLLYFKNRRLDTDKDLSADKSSKPKIKRNHSVLVPKADGGRLPTEANLNPLEASPPGKHKALIYSYLNKKKKPSAANSRPGSQKNLSFTTINNISMQNLINRNVSSYHMFNNKHLASLGKDCPASPLPVSSALTNPLAAGSSVRKSPLATTHKGGSAVCAEEAPNFQKKLKKYISKRSSVLKKAHQQ